MSHAPLPKLPPYEDTPEYWKAHDAFRDAYNTCGECGSKKLELRDYDMMWHDGELYCENGHHVRSWDAG